MTERTRQINLRVTDAEYEMLQAVAKQHERTVSSLVRLIVANELKVGESRILPP